MDTHSAKNADTAGVKGYDADKGFSDIKRHIAVDTQGLPPAVAATKANATNPNGALQALNRCKSGLRKVACTPIDSGYASEPFEQGVPRDPGRTRHKADR